MDITSLTQLVTAFRAETAANSITPETLGALLQQIVNALGTAAQDNSNVGNVLDKVSQNSSKIEELTTAVNELKTSDRSVSAVAKGFYRYNKIDDLNTTQNVGMYILNNTGKFGTIGMYGILIVSANYGAWIQQYYFGCLTPTDWSGNALDANIYTRTLYDGTWSQWKMFGT